MVGNIMNLDLSNKTLDVDVMWHREGYTIANVIEWEINAWLGLGFIKLKGEHDRPTILAMLYSGDRQIEFIE